MLEQVRCTMPVIDPKGLFEGQRLAACSDLAQSFWPRLYCAANGYARLELHYPTIVGRCFHYYKAVPSEPELLAVIREYVDNFLAIPYQAEGQWWLQFATEDKFLRRRKTAEDEKSPAPPIASVEAFASGYALWKEQQATRNHGDAMIYEMFPKYFRNPSDTFPPGVGVGVGDGVGIGIGNGVGFLTAAPSSAASADPCLTPSQVVEKGETTETVSSTLRVEHPPSSQNFPNQRTPFAAKRRATVEEYVRYWNTNCSPFWRVRKLTGKRLAKLKARIRDGWTPKEFAEDIDRLKASSFCQGDFKDWRAGFDFLVTKDKLQRLHEGAYDDAPKPVRPRRKTAQQRR